MLRLTTALALLFALAAFGCKPDAAPPVQTPESPAEPLPAVPLSEIQEAGKHVIDLVVNADLKGAVAAYHEYRVKLGGMDDLALIHAAFGEALIGGLIASEPPEGQITRILAVIGTSETPVQLDWVREMLADPKRAPLALSALRDWYGAEVDEVCREALASEETSLVTIAATYLVEDNYDGAEGEAMALIASNDWKRVVSGFKLLKIAKPDQAAEMLVERLRISEDTISIRLCEVAREWKLPLPLGILERLTERLNPDVRMAAVLATVNCEGEEYNEFLARLIETGKLDVALASAEILFNKGDERGEIALKAFVKQEIGVGRFRAAAPLYAGGDMSVIEDLKPFIEDIRQPVRLAVAWNLRLFPEPLDGFFEPLLYDVNEEVRTTAVESLGEIGTDSAAEILGGLSAAEVPELRYAAVRALGKMKTPGAMEQVLGFASDDESAVRLSVARALGEIGDSSAAETLAAMLRDEDSTVRVEAARSFGRLGDPELGRYLLPLIDDPELGANAQDQLIRLGRMEALEPLLAKVASEPGADGLLSVVENVFTLCAARSSSTE